MTFLWRDYNEKDRETVEGWLDAEAVRMTGMDEGFHSDYAYWSEQPEMVCGVNFWAKVFSVEDQPAGVMLLAAEEKALSVMEVLVDPALRGKGLGSAALRELLAEGKTVLGTPITAATAVIFPDNRPSARAFEKAGFVYASTHPDGDAMYYRYDKFSFSCLRGEEREALLPRLFAILHENMNAIAPTGNSYEEEETLWCSCIAEALEQEARKLLVIREGEAIAGFFMYYVNGDLWMMEEIQFAPAYHGSGLFSKLYAYLQSILPSSVTYVEAYANKKNEKSQGILKHLGLTVIGENKNGNSYHFRGRYSDLKEAAR
jgi:RimJ/RimL family protein N-acetyltransferase